MGEPDIVVVGGGIAGLTMAAILGGEDFSVVCIDRDELPSEDAAHSLSGRSTALLQGSVNVLKASGAWRYCENDAEPLWTMRLIDEGRPALLGTRITDFNAREMGDAPFGYNVLNSVLRQGLSKRIAELPQVEHRPGCETQAVELKNGQAIVTLADGRCYSPRLLIGADGKSSPCRRAADIAVTCWDYDQAALVFCIDHELPHNGVSIEFHRPTGPFTLVPMRGHRSSVVWVDKESRVPVFMAMDDEAFTQEVQQRTVGYLGAVSLAGPRSWFSLSAQNARRYAAPGLALIGEAAHALHPIGAQGLNLGMRDIATLAEVLVDAARHGYDIGSLKTLKTYESRRRRDAFTRLVATDSLSRIVANDILISHAFRALGHAVTQRVGPLRRFLMRQGMNPVGDTSRLLRGEAL